MGDVSEYAMRMREAQASRVVCESIMSREMCSYLDFRSLKNHKTTYGPLRQAAAKCARSLAR